MHTHIYSTNSHTYRRRDMENPGQLVHSVHLVQLEAVQKHIHMHVHMWECAYRYTHTHAETHIHTHANTSFP